jgi:hypothetical protein
MGIPIASWAISPSNSAVAAAAINEKEFDRPPHASTIAWSHNDPSVVRSSLIPNVIPTTLQQRVKAGFFLATRQVSGIITFRSITFSALNERDRRD